MVKYVKFQNTQQREFMRLVKKTSELTWIELAKIIGVDRSMIYFYLDESSKMPYKTFLLLLNRFKIEESKFKINFIEYNQQKDVILPKINNPKLAELVGLILGDGNLTGINYAINITMNRELDTLFLSTKVKQLFVDLFSKEPGIFQNTYPHNVRLVFYSKEVFQFLSEVIGLPPGKRKYNPKNIIPSYFFKNKLLLEGALRGLFDTEGGIYPHNNTLPRIEIFNTSIYLLDSMEKAFKLLNFHPIKKINRIKLCRTSEVVRFFEEIKPHSNQKLIKYDMWCQNRRVPKNSETLMILHGRSLTV
jgi:hypothetical protein